MMMPRRGHLRRARLLAVVVALAFTACARSSSPQGGGSASPTKTPSATCSVTPTVTPSPTGVPSGFTRATVTGGAAQASDWEPGGPRVVGVRIGRHAGFDRFVIEFDGTVPTYRVRVHPSTTFTLSPKDETVVLEGTGGALIRLFPVAWTAYDGPTSLHPAGLVLREARLLENYEGYQQWGLGVAGTPCYRVSTLDSPPRLVVDVATVAAG